MDDQTFDSFLKFWYKEVSKTTGEDVYLIFDNCSAHGDNLPELPGVECIFLPPKVTSVYQPLDMGVLLALKNNSRKHILLKILSNLENYDELRALGSKQRQGARGIDYCYPVNLLDAIGVVWHAFEKLSAQHVSNCWLKAGIPSCRHATELCEETTSELLRDTWWKS